MSATRNTDQLTVQSLIDILKQENPDLPVNVSLRNELGGNLGELRSVQVNHDDQNVILWGA